MSDLELVFMEERQMYKLKRDPESNSYLFIILVGGIGQYLVQFPLTADEYASYQKDGKSYLDHLAAEVRTRPEFYDNRNKA